MTDFLNKILKPEPVIGSEIKICEQKGECVKYFDIVETFIAECGKWIGKKETLGPNRSPGIDTINQAMGSPIGSPYCLNGLLYNLEAVEDLMAILFDLPKTGSTQNFWNETKEAYKMKEPKRGSIAIFQSRLNPAQGHAALCLGGANPVNKIFQTLEFNTNLSGDREGEGTYISSRSLEGSVKLKLLGFVDITKAVIGSEA